MSLGCRHILESLHIRVFSCFVYDRASGAIALGCGKCAGEGLRQGVG
jgi:hypothetical protein